MATKSPDEAKKQYENDPKTKQNIADIQAIQNDFLGETPKFFITFDDYGTNRILGTLVGGKVQQRFLIVDPNGRDYDFANQDQVVKQVRTYFKNNKEGLRKTLYNLGYMTEREYNTRSESGLTTAILKVANEYTVDIVDSIRIDGAKRFPVFTDWLKKIPASAGEGPRRPTRDINLQDRDVIRALVEDVYMTENMQLPTDKAIIEAKVDRYMDMIKKGTLTKYQEPNAAGEDESKTSAGFSEARLRAELTAEIPKEQPMDYQKAQSLNFLTFLGQME